MRLETNADKVCSYRASCQFLLLNDIVTRLRPDMDLPKAIEMGMTFCCVEGQSLEWLGLSGREQLHWFAVRDRNRFAAGARNKAGVRANFPLPPPITRLFLEQCRFSPLQPNGCCDRYAVGLRRVNRMKKISWGSTRCISTACAFAGAWYCWPTQS
jgi:hypothetical protein